MAPATPAVPLEEESTYEENLNIRLICKECREDPPQLIEDWKEGTMVCASCGLVLMSDMIDYRSEWRKFQNDDQGNDDPSRVGEVANPLLNGSQLSTEITFVSGDGRNRELQRAQNKANEDKNNRQLQDGYRSITSFTETMALGSAISNTAKMLYKSTMESKTFRGKSSDTIVAGCIFIACRRHNVGRSFKELNKLTNVPKKEIGRVFKQLEDFFKKQTRANGTSSAGRAAEYVATTSTSPKDLCGRFGGILGLPKPVSIIAGDCADLLLARGMLAGRSPLSVAAVAIYIISNLMGHSKTAKEVGEACAVSDGTIRTAWRKIYDARIDLIQEEWIRKGGNVEKLPPA
jgi:transcription initiation factor TFIIB